MIAKELQHLSKLKHIFPAELGASVALYKDKARPLCWCRKRIARKWTVEDAGAEPSHHIAYDCGKHSHGG